MSAERGAIAYIIQEGEQLYLCVIDDEQGTFDRHPISVRGCARLSSECGWVVNAAVGGFNPPLLAKGTLAQRVIG